MVNAYSAVYRNPVFHQVIFASIMFITAFRTWYILSNSDPSASSAKYRIPVRDRRTVTSLFSTGALTFAFGFFVWNLDNIFCNTVTRWKHVIGWPGAFLLEGMCRQYSILYILCFDWNEGHSWWHILTVSFPMYARLLTDMNVIARLLEHILCSLETLVCSLIPFIPLLY